MEVGGVMSQAPCVEEFVSFLQEVSGRLSFEDVEKRFAKALEENPVFAEIEKSGALGKNIIIILGGRGCGKTLMIRYIKHKLGRQGSRLRPRERKSSSN
jgi:polynucleotide 5'-kinase involved in rRNA processing